MASINRKSRRRPQPRKLKHPRRRGIVLLMVISLLVLFMLMLVTFAIVSGHYRDAAKAFAYRRALESDVSDGPAVQDQIMQMLLSEPGNPSSALWGWSFLNDMYGLSVNGIVTTNGLNQGSGTFCQFSAVRDGQQSFGAVQFSGTPGYYSGCVLTMKDGPCAGLSTRITHYAPGAQVTFRMEAFENGLLPQVGDRFVVNDKPFNGTGLGRPVSGEYANNAVDGNGRQWALMPHLARWQDRNAAAASLGGGADEGYDAFDPQNAFLAMAQTDVPGGRIRPSFYQQELLDYWDQRVAIEAGDPSVSIYDANHVDLLRQIMFRPLVADHPNFLSANAAFNPASPLFDTSLTAADRRNAAWAAGNFWDVDNDNDGTPDSIWIDPGLPVLTAADGRRYKQLVALLIRDQEGKPNVNAVGNTEWVKAQFQPGTPLQGPLAGNANNTPLLMHRGLGFGPAETQFLHMFQLDGENLATASNFYTRILQGTQQALPVEAIPGRYGLDAPIGTLPTNRRPGAAGPAGVAYSNDELSVVKMYGHGLDYVGSDFSLNASPPDVWGRGALALDFTGQPYPFSMAQPTDWPGPPAEQTAEVNDNPYEINLVDSQASVDTPYTVAELETVLRRFDADAASMPMRLFTFLNPTPPNGSASFNGFNRRANSLTTLGADVRAPRGAVPRYMRRTFTPPANENDPNDANYDYYGPVAPSILDICLARINHPSSSSLPAGAAQQAVLAQIMPFELFHGEMFNINRPFGNGADDRFDGSDDNTNGEVDEPGESVGNGVVDEPGESNTGDPATTEWAWGAGIFKGDPNAGGGAYPLNDARANWWTNPPATPTPQPNLGYHQPAYLNFLNTDPQLYARQLFARNLYCMMLLMCEPDYTGEFTEPSLNDGIDADGSTMSGGLEDLLMRRKLFCRRVAQYAVNVVDFRDPDAIMTPFEYDENPFDGWNVDGNLVTNENAIEIPQGMTTVPWLPNQDRGLVWGMEYPDLQLTESLCMHNRRVKDTAHDDDDQKKRFDSSNMVEDQDVDQYGLPQGSMFLELFCARNNVVNNPKLPVELYDPSGGLDLGRLAPQRSFSSGNSGRHPVWRAVVANNPEIGGSATSIRNYAATYPESTVFEPAALNVQPERIVFFSPYDAANLPEADLVFYERTGSLDLSGAANSPAPSSVLLGPGQYAVAAPRLDTRLGALVNGADGNPLTYEQSPLRFTVGGGSFSTAGGAANNGFNPYPRGGVPIRPRVGLVCAANVPAAWGTPPAEVPYIGMNISEPLPSATYYPKPSVGTNYADILEVHSAVPPLNELPDRPFDDDPTYDSPLQNDTTNAVRTGTREDFRCIFLQRLANPLQPWNPAPDDPQFAAEHNASLPVNPYITVDWSTLDLTVFSGDENTNDQPDGSTWLDPSDPNPFGSAPDEMFAGRERGRPAGGSFTPFWQNVVRDLPDSNNTGDTDHYFHHGPDHTLGYLNSTLGAVQNPAPAAGYEGFPVGGFPWLAWNNRPFANPMELLTVPLSSPNRLGREFGFGEVQPYNPAAADPNPQGFFRHLPNFFLSTHYPVGGGAPTAQGSDLYRLFDLVDVPSPYVGAERWYRPDMVNAGAQGESYRAPFNRLSRFRDPGRVNINTVVDPLVWQALIATYPDIPVSFSDVVRSRRGFQASADDGSMLDMFRGDPAYPSIFCNPFRPADASDLMPLDIMQLTRPVDATLLRGAEPPLVEGGGPPNPDATPLLNNTQHHITDPTDPNIIKRYYRATDRNATFRYQPYTKLANMVTTNSNTFAVWMTVGYFEAEVNPTGVDTAHPDGYRIGAEMIWESGQVKRPRGFYIIDRSIPVGFEPGQQLNTDRCILQRRYLE